ncbi:hypothetical protein DFH06DRAFT_1380654 [Mycena polygramma]|nr:hypothetical protein DFH06DRAFT_1380654 [Mycena polygramma]
MHSPAQPKFFQERIRHLFIRPGTPSASALECPIVKGILSTCHKIHSIASDASLGDELYELSKTGKVKPRRLSAYLADVLPIMQDQQHDKPPGPTLRDMFSVLTHLDILDIESMHKDELVPWLTGLSELTHLSLRRGFELAADLLAPCKKLEVLICMHRERKNKDELAHVPDGDRHRFVYMWRPDPRDKPRPECYQDPWTSWSRQAASKPRDLLDDWFKGTKEGEEDFWVHAQNFIEMKQRRTIEEGSFTLSYFLCPF